MKRIICSVLSALLVLSLCSCGDNNTKENPYSEVNRTEVSKYCDLVRVAYAALDTNSTEEICYDANTGVMYYFLIDWKQGFMSVIYNTDGTPKIYEGWVDPNA